MADATVTELRPSPAKGEGPSALRPKDPTAALRQRRTRAKRKSVTISVTQPEIQKFEKPNEIKADVTVARDATVAVENANQTKGVTPFTQPKWQVGVTADRLPTSPEHRSKDRTSIDMAAYMAAIGLASVAAWFSIRGMIVIFPGAPVAIVAMAAMMEAAKLVTAGWLASRWRTTAWIWRLVLVVLVLGLAVINGVGVFSQLVAAHVGERGEAASAIETQDAALAARIEVGAHTVADLDRRLGQIDAAVEEASKRGRTTGAMSIMEGQKKARAALVEERNREAGILAALKAERAALGAKGRQIETEAAPIRYVAELIGVANDSERAIRWLILMMVLCCDPLAISLTAVASARR